MATIEPPVGVGIALPLERSTRQSSYVDWPAVLAGAVLASAISMLFMSFGSAIGLTMVSTPRAEGVPGHWFLVAAALWFVWVSVSSVMAGGYLTGRLRRRVDDATEHEVDVRDGAHGLLVWATAVLLGGTLAVLGVAGVAQTAASAAATVSRAAATVTAHDGADGSQSYRWLADTLFRTDPPRLNATSEAARAEVARILATATSGKEALEESDKDYISSIVANETALDQGEARRRVDTIITRVETAKADAREVAEKARISGVLIGFLIAASLLASAAGGYIASGIGGRHRDEGVVFAGWGHRR